MRKPKNYITAEADPNPQIPSIIQSTRTKSTISSLFLSTFSSNETTPTTSSKKKTNNFTQTTFRGLGCAAAASQQVSVPAVIRTSADWDAKKVKKKKKKHQQQKKNGNNQSTSSNGTMKISGENKVIDGGCVVIQDVWCAPGIGFSTDAVVDGSVDCVVSAPRRNVSGRGKIDGEKINNNHREQSFFPRRVVTPETFSLLDSDSFFMSTRPEPDVFGARYNRQVRYPSPDGLTEIMMLQNSLLMGGRFESHDRFREWRLDVDDMTYEQLLDLGDRIGYVSTGLKDDDISHCLRKMKNSIPNDLHTNSRTHIDKKCIICQEEYESDDEMGKLNCGHGFHIQCIKQWLSQKNSCPVCKAAAMAQP